MSNNRKNMRLVLILLSSVLCFQLQAQDISILKEKANSFLSSNLDSSLYYWQQIEQLAQAQANNHEQSTALTTIASLYRFKNDCEQATIYDNKCLAIATTPTFVWSALNGLGMCLIKTDRQQADSIFQRALKQAYLTEVDLNISTTYGNLSTLKREQGQLHKAIEYGIQALNHASDDYAKIPKCNVLASLFQSINNLDRAEEYFKKAIELGERNNYKVRNQFIALNYATLLLEKKEFERAKSEIDLALKHNESSKMHRKHYLSAIRVEADYYILTQNWDAAAANMNKLMLNYADLDNLAKIRALSTQAKILLHQQAYAQVIETSQKIIALSVPNNLVQDTKNAQLYAAQAHEALKQYQAAHLAFKSYHQLKDSLTNSRQSDYVNHLEADFKRKEQENTIALLDTQNEAQATRLSLQNRIIWIGGSSFVVILALLAFLMASLRKIKKQNQIISKTLEEKDTLLREIHHRVKNNLQLVSSLLGLQSQHVEDPNALEVLQSGKARVKSMALIHQDLYNRENLTGVSVKEYLEKLSKELMSTYQINANQIQLTTDIQHIDLDVDSLVPIGLIVNELLSNALKHAFPDGRKGNIHIQFLEENDLLKLVVKDDGIGMQLDQRSTSSFGYRLIETLLDQLEGSMTYDSSNGTAIAFVFQDYKIAA